MSQLRNVVVRARKSSLFRDSFWALFGSALGKGLSLLAGIAIARFLGKEIYGEYGMIKNTLLMIAVFSSFGLGYTATKFIAESRNENPHRALLVHRIAQRVTLVASGFIAMLVCVFADYVAVWLEAPHLVNVLRLSAVAIVFNAVNTTQTGELSGYNAYKAIAVNNLIAGVLTFFLSVGFTYLWALEGAIVALVLSLIANCMLNYFSLRRELCRDNLQIKDNVLFKEILSFSFPVALQESLYSVTHWLNVVILIKLAGYGELGLSSAAGQWMAVMLFVPGALRNVALSHLSATNTDRTANHQTLKKLLMVNFVSTFIPFLVILILSGWICSWYGEDYKGMQAVLNVSVFTAVVNSLTNVFVQEFMAKNRNWYLFFTRLLRDVGILVVAYFCLLEIKHSGALIFAIVSFCFQTLYFMFLWFKYKLVMK